MPEYIINGEIAENPWTRVTPEQYDESGLPGANALIVPLGVWQEQGDALRERYDYIGVCLEPGEEPEEIANDLDRLDVVAIHFPQFKDGRGFSYARELRTRYDFGGDVLAVGDVLRDQLFYMHRCGFNAFEPRTDRDIRVALEGLKDFSIAYQGDVHDPRPIYRRSESPVNEGIRRTG